MDCVNDPCGESVIVSPIQSAPPLQATPPLPREFESVPEIESESIPPVDTSGFSSRSHRKDDSTSETIAQLQPPVAAPSQGFQPTLSVKSHRDERGLGTAKQSAPTSINKPVLDPSSFPAVDPYYGTNSVNNDASEQGYQPFPVAATAPQGDQPGAEFDKLAEEIFQQIDLREKLELTPLPIPTRPVSTEILNSAPNTESNQESEEIFGAIQFDAVLRQSANDGLYAQEVEPEYKIASLPPESKPQFLIRPLPKMPEIAPQPVPSHEEFEFQSMPAYHMPTLRAIPETELHEKLPPVFKIRFEELPQSQEKKQSVLVPNPFLESPAKTTAPQFRTLPNDPQPMIQPLPRIQEDQSVPAIENRHVNSDRRLTNRNEAANPLR